jgi:hypothetical protein
MSENRKLSQKEIQFLIDFHKLLVKYQVSFNYTNRDDGVHIAVDGLKTDAPDVFVGFLSTAEDLMEYEKIIEPYLSKAQLYHLKLNRAFVKADQKCKTTNEKFLIPDELTSWDMEFMKNLEEEGFMLVEENKFQADSSDRDAYPNGFPFRAPESRHTQAGGNNVSSWHPFSLVVWK